MECDHTTQSNVDEQSKCIVHWGRWKLQLALTIMLLTFFTYFLSLPHLDMTKVEIFWVKAAATQQRKRRKILGVCLVLCVIIAWHSKKVNVKIKIRTIFCRLSVSVVYCDSRKIILRGKEKGAT